MSLGSAEDRVSSIPTTQEGIHPTGVVHLSTLLSLIQYIERTLSYEQLWLRLSKIHCCTLQVARKLLMCEAELERAEDRGDAAES